MTRIALVAATAVGVFFAQVFGVAPERALLLSVCFGLALAFGSLPGALTWLLYPFPPVRQNAERVG
jgi:hypothetical protein